MNKAREFTPLIALLFTVQVYAIGSDNVAYDQCNEAAKRIERQGLGSAFETSVKMNRAATPGAGRGVAGDAAAFGAAAAKGMEIGTRGLDALSEAADECARACDPKQGTTASEKKMIQTRLEHCKEFLGGVGDQIKDGMKGDDQAKKGAEDTQKQAQQQQGGGSGGGSPGGGSPSSPQKNNDQAKNQQQQQQPIVAQRQPQNPCNATTAFTAAGGPNCASQVLTSGDCMTAFSRAQPGCRQFYATATQTCSGGSKNSFCNGFRVASVCSQILASGGKPPSGCSEYMPKSASAQSLHFEGTPFTTGSGFQREDADAEGEDRVANGRLRRMRAQSEGGGGEADGSSAEEFPRRKSLFSRSPASEEFVAGYDGASDGPARDVSGRVGNLMQMVSAIYVRRCDAGRFHHCGDEPTAPVSQDPN